MGERKARVAITSANGRTYEYTGWKAMLIGIPLTVGCLLPFIILGVLCILGLIKLSELVGA